MSDIWQASTDYNKGDLRRPASDNGYIYICITAGTTGGNEPTWNTDLLSTTTDGTVEWLCLKKNISVNVLDQAIDYIKNNATAMSVCEKIPTNYYQACNPAEWQASTAVAEGDVVRPVGTRNGFVYECITPGTTDAAEPIWPTTEDTAVTDGSVTWIAVQSFALCTAGLTSTDFTIDIGQLGGKVITTAEKDNILIYKTGLGNAVAILDDNAKALFLTTIPTTQQNFQEGAQAKITTFKYELEQPSV
jgi:hypothetical protein